MQEQKEKIIDTEVADVSTVSVRPLEINDEAKKVEHELENIAPTEEERVLTTKSPSKKILIAILFIAINLLAILVTVVMEFTSNKAPVPLSAVFSTFWENFGWGICAIVAFLLAIGFDSLKRYVILQSALKTRLPLTSLVSTIICRYYDNITPMASGGQPFEIRYLRKKGIPIGIASGAPIVGYAIDRIAYVFVSLVAILLYGLGNIESVTIKVLCLIGLVANALIPFAIFFFTFMPKIADKFSVLIAKILHKLRIVKDEKAFIEKLTGNIKEYVNCLKYFTQKSKITMLRAFIYSCLYFVALYSIPFFTIRFSGHHDVAWGEMIALCVICYLSVTLMPTPGGSGAAEISFRSIFSTYLTGGLLFWGMLAWRIFSYYFFIIAGIVVIIIQHTKKVVVLKFHPDAVQQEQTKPLSNDSEQQDLSGQNATRVDDDDLNYVVPTKSLIQTEDIDFADIVIEAEATIEAEEQAESEQPLEAADAETVVNLEVVIESTSKAVIVEHDETEGENIPSNLGSSLIAANSEIANEQSDDSVLLKEISTAGDGVDNEEQ